MNNREKYIGINNRMPFVVIDDALNDFIKTDEINRALYLSHIKEFTKGENRANKTLNNLVAILKRNEKIIRFFIKSLNGNNYSEISQNDKRAIILNLFCIAYPIAYEMLNAFSVGFKVQTVLNKQFLLQKMGAIYGGNRAMHIAIDEVIPFFIDCDLIKREKVGIFSLGKKIKFNSQFLNELVIYSDIRLSGSKSILIDDLSFRPWYSFFDTSEFKIDNLNLLISKKDSAVGKGYLTIKFTN